MTPYSRDDPELPSRVIRFGTDGRRPLSSYVLSLSLENVGCFGPRQTVNFKTNEGRPAPWTIIFGLNGSGKTTILQALVGFEVWPTFHHRFFEYFDGFVESRRTGRKQQAVWELESGCFEGITSAVRGRSLNRFTLRSRSDHLFSPGEGAIEQVGPVAGLWFCGYGAGRRLGAAQLSIGTGQSDDPTGSLFADAAELRNPEEWLLQLDYATSKQNGAGHAVRRRLKQAEDLLLEVLHGIDGIRFVSRGEAFPQLHVEFNTFSGWVPLRQLGYGYQTLITWVADLVSRMVERYPDSPNPLAEPAVVLVDEIDLHLHPVWQRKLMGYLTERFPNTQFIATAHSPLVAQAAADANLAVLRREGDHVVIDNDVDDIRNWRIDQILTSDLFGLETARPPRIEAALRELRALQTKAKRSKADERRVRELEAEIGDLPTGESKQEIEERKHIRETLDRLLKERKPAP